MGLSHCTQLQSLALYVSLGDEESYRESVDAALCSAVIEILSSAPRTIQDITLRFRLTECNSELLAPEEEENMDWGRLEDVIGEFERLTSVTIEVEEKAMVEYADNCRRIIEDRMPFTKKKGLLRFQTRPIERDVSVCLSTLLHLGRIIIHIFCSTYSK